MGSMARTPKSVTPAEVARAAPAQVSAAVSNGAGEAAQAPARAPVSTGDESGDRLRTASVVAPELPPLAPSSAPPLAPSSAPPLAPRSIAEGAATPRSVLRDTRETVAAPVAHVDLTHSIRLDKEASQPEPQRMVARPALGERPVAAATVAGARSPTFAAPSDMVSGSGKAAALAGPAASAAPAAPAAPVWARLRLDHYASQGAEAVVPAAGEMPSPNGSTQRLAVQGPPPPVAARCQPLAPVFVDAAQPKGAAQRGSELASAVPRTDGEASGAAASGAAGPVQGDVFLDGALVGRWMSRHLSREAGRASAGPTGFDSRRNALLPGATVGG
jgi:hypothetical protein